MIVSDQLLCRYRNNEPIKKGKTYRVEQSGGVATLEILECKQEDVAEYKLEATNPAGKAASVANLVLQRPFIFLFFSHFSTLLVPVLTDVYSTVV